jgi:cysteine desulfurase
VASLIGATAKEVVFTSGATESNNLAVKGVAEFYKQRRNHIITTATEHKCVLDSCRHLEHQQRGEGEAGKSLFEVTYLPVLKSGLIDLKVLEAAITPKTCLVSVMAVNNEIGVIQPLAEIGKLCRKNGGKQLFDLWLFCSRFFRPPVFFHTDAAQAVGKIPIDVKQMNIDLLSISGHKLYGPKGVGALYINRKPRVRLVPLINGGGQERGHRSGTLPAPLVVGLGAGEKPSRLFFLFSCCSRSLSCGKGGDGV